MTTPSPKSAATDVPAIYLYVDDEERRHISVSTFPMDHPDHENYRMVLVEAERPKTPVSISMNILRNVLSATGIQVILE